MAQIHRVWQLYHVTRAYYQILQQVLLQIGGNTKGKHVTDKARSDTDKIK